MLVEYITVIIDTGKEIKFDMKKWTHVQTSSEGIFRHSNGKQEWSIPLEHIAAIFREGKPQ